MPSSHATRREWWSAHVRARLCDSEVVAQCCIRVASCKLAAHHITRNDAIAAGIHDVADIEARIRTQALALRMAGRALVRALVDMARRYAVWVDALRLMQSCQHDHIGVVGERIAPLVAHAVAQAKV